MGKVLFVSRRPLGRAENITAIYNAYDGEKEFIQEIWRKPDPRIFSKDFSVIVTDEFVGYSPGKMILIGHGISGGKSYGLDQPYGYYKKELAGLIDWAVCTSKDTIALTAAQSGIAEEKVLPLGMPRTDQYFGKKKGDGETFLAGKRAYLFAPTFRNPHEPSMPEYDWSYLDSILKQLGVEAEFVVTAGAESAMIEIVAANNGTVIGKRGETLDALQYLTFMIANRGDKDYYRIILNSANYRERRRKTLEELAAKIARNVQRSGRQTTLEPMNPYERRIIHSAIAEIEGVSSRSIGEEPYRKVVISSTTRPQRAGGRRGERSDRNDRGDRRGRDRGRRGNDRRDRRRSDAPPQRMSMDSMKTSFERDYKRPKEDDDINTGLYGKIEF